MGLEYNNRMTDVQVITKRLDPMEAEVWIVGPGEITGRLMGPRLAYATTIEVAYYLHMPKRGQEFAGKRVVIPEPELVGAGHAVSVRGRADRGRAEDHDSHGLRRVEMTPLGLRLNQKPIALKHCRRERIDEAEMGALHEAGVNALVCPVHAATLAVWDAADRIGMFMIGVADTSEAMALVPLCSHASCLVGRSRAARMDARLSNRNGVMRQSFRSAKRKPLNSSCDAPGSAGLSRG